ncbi:hypothetical protein RS9916_32027 [Synechococcus sp. RS9916]|nr:hypothetical protein RS9916_32027 [Synechococcus sp. RS9916]
MGCRGLTKDEQTGLTAINYWVAQQEPHKRIGFAKHTATVRPPRHPWRHAQKGPPPY